MIYKGNPVDEGKSNKIRQKSVHLQKCWDTIFEKKKIIFFKTKFFESYCLYEVHENEFLWQSDHGNLSPDHRIPCRKFAKNDENRDILQRALSYIKIYKLNHFPAWRSSKKADFIERHEMSSCAEMRRATLKKIGRERGDDIYFGFLRKKFTPTIPNLVYQLEL